MVNKCFDNMLAISKLPVRWLRFYVKFRFPFGIISSLLFFLSSLINTDFSAYDTYSLFYVLFFFSLDFVNIILMSWTYSEMKSLTCKGYVLNLIYLYFFEIYFAVVQGLKFSATGHFWIGFLVFSLVGLLWLIPNLIYFQKRKDMFSANKPAILHTQNSKTDKNSSQENISNSIITDQNDIFLAIEKLNELQEKGALTKEEFMEKKKELLSKI